MGNKQAGNYGLGSLVSINISEQNQVPMRQEPPAHVRVAIEESLKSIQENPKSPRSKSPKPKVRRGKPRVSSSSSNSRQNKKSLRSSMRSSVRDKLSPSSSKSSEKSKNQSKLRSSVISDLGDDDSDDNLCIICEDNKKTHMCYPCGHKTFCASCVKDCKKDLKECPLCRKAIKDIIKVFD